MDQEAVPGCYWRHELDANRPPLAMVVLAYCVGVAAVHYRDRHGHVTAHETAIDDRADSAVGIWINERKTLGGHEMSLALSCSSSSSKASPMPLSMLRVALASASSTFDSAKPT